MNILFITLHYLSCNGGGSFASRAYINAFAEVSSHLSLLHPIKDGEGLFDGINPKIETIPVANTAPRWKKLWHILSGKVHRFDEKAREIAGREHFDLVVFDTSVVSYRLIDLFKKSGSRVAVIHHNYQYEYFRDNTPLWLKSPTLFWCKRYEGEAVRKADINLALTKQDILLLADRYNGGKTSGFRLLSTFEYKQQAANVINEGTTDTQNFAITGDLSAVQTKLSLIPWIKDYLPILRDVFPGSKVTVAGKNPDNFLTELCLKNGIELIPSPESMDSIMKNADFYICPVCLGGGIKLRVLDGLKWGLPVISHSVSARGYDHFIEQGYLLSYSDKAGFRQALNILREKDFNKNTVLESYRRLFSFDAGVSRVKAILNELFQA